MTGAVGGAVDAVGGTVGGVVDTAVSGISAVTGFEASVVSFIITSFTTVLQVHSAPIFIMLPHHLPQFLGNVLLFAAADKIVKLLLLLLVKGHIFSGEVREGSRL